MRTGRYCDRVGTGALVYLAAVIEYLAAEVLELAGNAAKDKKIQEYYQDIFSLATRNDEELNRLIANTLISDGGVLPNINSALLPSKTGKGKGDES